MDNRAAWETEAGSWLNWARTPNHDAYWQYREPFFELILPPAGRHTLEVGCGEGRVARDLVAAGHQVIALDGSPTLVRHATSVDTRARYCVGDAAKLPFPDRSFDLVVAYNSLMDIDDMHGAVLEAARVLEPGGRFCVCVTHPLLNAGRFAGRDADAEYHLTESYLTTRRFDGVEERDGLTMHFTGWSHSLETYVTAMTNAGFVIDQLREPIPTDSGGDFERWHRYPMFLHLGAIRR